MKNVYLVQPNNIQLGDIHLPYAVGAIAAYAWQFEEIYNAYQLCEIFFKKDPIEEVLQRFQEPFFVGFSCYMWNVEYNLVLARRLKEKYPECFIAFGGPQIPDDTEYLEKYSFIDLLMYGEGEITFHRVLAELINKKDFSHIKNISYRNSGENIKTGRWYNKDLSNFPSPYAAGMFDKIVKDPANKNLRFSAVIETNRGCPYSCIYCYWAGTVKNFRLFPMEKVKKDIDWIADNKIIYCACVDSNYGILPRDMETTDYIINKKKKCGYPIKYETSTAKNKEDIVFAISQKLHDAGMSTGVSVAVQTMSPIVLENIGRKNISNENFAEQLEMYNNAGMAPYTDFILGLPGETYESFMHGLFLAIEAGQHSYLNIHPCEVLPNTRLYDKKVQEQFSIKTMKSVLNLVHSVRGSVEDEYGSRSEIVIETASMSREDWVKSLCFSTTVQVFHSFCLLRYIAWYLRKTQNISYEHFYTLLYKTIHKKNAFIKQTMNEIFNCIELFSKGKGAYSYYNEFFTDSYLDFKEGLLLCFIRNRDLFYEEVKEYISPFFDDKELFEDLFHYQKQSIKYPACKEENFHFCYNWQEYFKDVLRKDTAVPEKKEIEVYSPACKEQTWDAYTKNNVWYGKREQKMLRAFKLVDEH